MPEISRFHGIIVFMFYQDHLPAHFHIRYERYRAAVTINDLRTLHGRLPPRVKRMVVEWALEHKEELSLNWYRARAKKKLVEIAPLN